MTFLMISLFDDQNFLEISWPIELLFYQVSFYSLLFILSSSFFPLYSFLFIFSSLFLPFESLNSSKSSSSTMIISVILTYFHCI